MNAVPKLELFHLLFCRQLLGKVAKDLFVLKGGCNLRFFYQSFRYSEDIDFDIQTIAVKTLEKNVDQILSDANFLSILKNRKLSIQFTSKPKQTETTQKWKIHLLDQETSQVLPTKIEFSRRGLQDDFILEPVSSEVCLNYQLTPPLLQHYLPARACTQKVLALAGRSETQARDVIDLDILVKQLNNKKQQIKNCPAVSSAEKKEAIERTMALKYTDFKSQVWPFLQTDYQDFYSSASRWDELQEKVIQIIENFPEVK